MPSHLSRRHVLVSAAATAAVAAMPAASAIAAVEVAPALTTYVPEAFNGTPPPFMSGYRFLSRAEFLEKLDKPLSFDVSLERMPWKLEGRS